MLLEEDDLFCEEEDDLLLPLLLPLFLVECSDRFDRPLVSSSLDGLGDLLLELDLRLLRCSLSCSFASVISLLLPSDGLLLLLLDDDLLLLRLLPLLLLLLDQLFLELCCSLSSSLMLSKVSTSFNENEEDSFRFGIVGGRSSLSTP